MGREGSCRRFRRLRLDVVTRIFDVTGARDDGGAARARSLLAQPAHADAARSGRHEAHRARPMALDGRVPTPSFYS